MLGNIKSSSNFIGPTKRPKMIESQSENEILSGFLVSTERYSRLYADLGTIAVVTLRTRHSQGRKLNPL